MQYSLLVSEATGRFESLSLMTFFPGWLVPWGWAAVLAVTTRWMWKIALMHEKDEQPGEG
jgi:hypothetical protein